MGSTAKWLRGSRPPPPAFIPSSWEERSKDLHFIKLWSYHYQQHKANNNAAGGGCCCDVKMQAADKLFPEKNEADLVLLRHLDNCHLPQTNKTERLALCDKGLAASLHPEKEKSTDVIATQRGLHTTSFRKMETRINMSKGELLEALCRSQRRAREAEKAAQAACNEKQHVIALFLKQASHIFAYKQWLYILHLETLTHNSRRRRRRRRRRISHHHFHDSVPWKSVVLGLALVGAGVLLGWTLGWLFHAL